MKARLVWIFLGLSAFLLSGCGDGGPALYEIEGTVTYKGAAVKDATVSVVFDSGLISTGATGADGKFTVTTNGLPGAPVGAARLSITKMSSTGMENMTADEMAKRIPGNGPLETPKSEIPEKYGSASTSGLTMEVVAGGKAKNTFTFPLAD